MLGIESIENDLLVIYINLHNQSTVESLVEVDKLEASSNIGRFAQKS